MNWPGHKFALTFFGGVIVAWLVLMFALVRGAALPAEASGTMLAVFEPSITETAAVNAIAAAHGNVVKKSGLAFAWVVQSDEPGLAGRMRAQGAIGVYRELPISPALMGCIAVADAKVENALTQ